MRYHLLTWDEFVEFMCGRYGYSACPEELSDDEWYDLKQEFKYGREHYSKEAAKARRR